MTAMFTPSPAASRVQRTFLVERAALRSLKICVSLIAVLLLNAAAAHAGRKNRVESSCPIPLFSVAPAVEEVSAAVYDPETHMLWSLGDSGTGTSIGRTDLAAGTTETITVLGADNTDWEALVADEYANLWIVDAGDNGAVRSGVVFYLIDPESLDGDTISVERSIAVSYADGPMDVEAALYFDEHIYLIEKIPLLSERRTARIVRIDAAPGAEDTQLAEPAGELRLGAAVTDAALTSEGTLYVLTYIGVFACPNWSAGLCRAAPLRFFFVGQQETLVLLTDNLLLIGAESGYFFALLVALPRTVFLTSPGSSLACGF